MTRTLFAFMALLGAIGPTGCIIKPDCVYTVKKGHPWRATVIGTGLKDDQPAFAEGTGEQCMSDAEDKILEAADPNDPEYVVLRSQLLVEALAKCTKVAISDGLKNIQCDPFDPEFDGIVQLARLEGTCLQSLADGLEGTPLKKNAHCPDKPAEAAEGESSTGAALADTGEPTTGAEEALEHRIDCDDTTCRVSQTVVDALLTAPDQFPLQWLAERGEVVGLLLTDVRPGGLADQLGFHRGELIVGIDGRAFTTLDDLLPLASAALTAGSVTLSTRLGQHPRERLFLRD